MPEVGETPPIHELFTQGDVNTLRISEFSEQQLKELPLDQIQGILRGSLARQFKAAEGDPELQRVIRTVPVFAFGPLAFRTERFAPTEDIDQKESNARLQQTLVHAIYYAGLPSADDTFAETIYQMVRTVEPLYGRSESEFDNLKMWWKGIKVELAVVKALKSRQFKVNLPNYGNNSKEVLQMDVR